MTNNPHTGSAFDDFLREESLYEECSVIAIKRVLARQLAEEMKQKKITKT
jgi:antitoxin HicB